MTDRPKWEGFRLAMDVIAIVLSVIALNQSCAVRDQERDSTRRKRELDAFVLGRRVSAYETSREAADSLTSYEAIPDSQRYGALKRLKEADYFEGAALRRAAQDLGIDVVQDDELWRLDRSIYWQLKDRHDSRVGDAYKLGRKLGVCDPRAWVFMLVSEDSTEWGAARDVADPQRFPRWHGDVDSLLRTLRYPVRTAWTNDENLWLRLAKGRVLLDEVTQWLDSRKRTRQEIGADWEFALLIKRRGAAPKGYTTVVGPVSVSRANVDTFERDFRRTAWADTIALPSTR